MKVSDPRVLKSIINQISGNDKLYSNRVEFKAHLHIDDKQTFFLNIFNSLEISRDFGNYTGDFKVVRFTVPLGDFVHIISPNRDKLSITLEEKREGFKPRKNKYQLRLLNEAADEPDVALKRKSLPELNKDGIFNITAELVCTDYIKYKYHVVEGTWNDSNPYALLKKLLMIAGSLLNFKFYNVKMVDSHNTRIYNQITIPDGTPLLRVGSYLQETDYGIYDGDLNTYVKEDMGKITTFVYPLYNIERTYPKNRLIIVALDSVKYTMYEKTYKIDGDNLKILVNGTKIKDHAKDNEDSKGHGINIINSDTIMGRPIEWIMDEPASNPAKVQDKLVHEKTNPDKPLITPSVVTSNYKNEKSKILRNTGEVITVNWKYGHSDWLYPGMPVTYVFEYGNKVVELNGVLHKTHYVANNQEYRSMLSLFIFLEKFNSDKIKK